MNRVSFIAREPRATEDSSAVNLAKSVTGSLQKAKAHRQACKRCTARVLDAIFEFTEDEKEEMETWFGWISVIANKLTQIVVAISPLVVVYLIIMF
ncbi:Hypothetical protein NTJ_14927 [Nesidiocoris tenuis]|uniref:Uncharacterized protein n=1 Tax=Nesidiocoris tenuis TaxID=355587 RepID=A0ABN7BCT1_9HEMI|nr:Hypothetical protein NTJ_14927 [Nesidiocoris tenuis]